MKQYHRDDQRGTLWSDCTLDHGEALDTNTLEKNKETLEEFVTQPGIWSLSLLSMKLKKKEKFMRLDGDFLRHHFFGR